MKQIYTGGSRKEKKMSKFRKRKAVMRTDGETLQGNKAQKRMGGQKENENLEKVKVVRGRKRVNTEQLKKRGEKMGRYTSEGKMRKRRRCTAQEQRRRKTRDDGRGVRSAGERERWRERGKGGGGGGGEDGKMGVYHEEISGYGGRVGDGRG